MLNITCERCRKQLDKPGGLFVSPPVGGSSVRYDLCYECGYKMLEFIKTGTDDPPLEVETRIGKKP